MNLDSTLQWSLSVQAMVMLWLMGNGNKWGPVVGIVGQIIWIWYSVKTEQWGLVPGVLMFTVIHARNCRKWWMR
jgi:hypothetical protein